MNGNHKTLFVVFSIIITVLLIASIGLNAFSLLKIKENSDAINSYFGTPEDTADEDNILIAGRYEILPTTAISDAYISGDSSKLSDRDKETLEMAEKVLKKIIKKDMTDYQKEKAVYIYLVKNLTGSDDVLTVISQNSSENSDPHDVLKNKSAVCVGYATTFRMFMQMLGIECKIVHSSDLTHSWDLVKLEDDWYHTDCYSDNGGMLYANFNMDDTMCSVNHIWTKENYPAAEGTKYNYVLKCAEKMKSIYDMPEYVAKQIMKNKELISCSFESLNQNQQRAASYLADSLSSSFSGEERSVSVSWTKDADNNFIAVINVVYYTESTELDDKTIEKVDNLIAEIAAKYGFEGYYEDYNDDNYYDDYDPNVSVSKVIAKG